MQMGLADKLSTIDSLPRRVPEMHRHFQDLYDFSFECGRLLLLRNCLPPHGGALIALVCSSPP